MKRRWSNNRVFYKKRKSSVWQEAYQLFNKKTFASIKGAGAGLLSGLGFSCWIYVGSRVVGTHKEFLRELDYSTSGTGCVSFLHVCFQFNDESGHHNIVSQCDFSRVTKNRDSSRIIDSSHAITDSTIVQTTFSFSSEVSRNCAATSMPKMFMLALSTSKKLATGLHEKGFRSFSSEICADVRLFLAIKSLYSCSEVCVRFSGVKPKPFTVGVGLWKGCVLSPVHFMVHT